MKTLPLSCFFILVFLSSCKTSQVVISKLSLFRSDTAHEIYISKVTGLEKGYRLGTYCRFDSTALPVDVVYLNEDKLLLKDGMVRITQPALDSLQIVSSYFGQPLSIQLANQDRDIFYQETFPVPEALKFSIPEGQAPSIFPGCTLHWNGPVNPDQTLYFYLDYDPVANLKHYKKKGLQKKIQWLVKVLDIGHYTFQKKDFPREFPDDVKLAMSAIRIAKQEVSIGESQMNLMVHSEVQGFFVYKQDKDLY